ncbi:MAG: sugar-binding domain-containing protein [Rikenellaceae bacterium]
MKRVKIILLALFATASASAQRVEFEHRFNPVDGVVHPSQSDYRDELCLNGEWQFMPIYTSNKSDFVLPGSFEWDNVPIKIPSPWNINGYTSTFSEKGKWGGGDFEVYPSYPEQWEQATIGWMRREVELPLDWRSSSVKLLFKGVMGNSVVYVNGQKVGENFDLFLPFEFDVTDLLREGKNEILVGVAKGSLYEDRGDYGRRPFVGGSSFATYAAGIWQDVFLIATPRVYVSDIFIKPRVSQGQLVAELTITNQSSKSVKVDVSANVYEWINLASDSLIDAPVAKSKLAPKATIAFERVKKVLIEADSQITITMSVDVADGDLKYWTPDSPNLYSALFEVATKKSVIDVGYERFGWREFKINGTDLELNGQKIVLKGDSWHFLGAPQLTRRYAWAWYTMLKEANANAVRPHAQVYPEFYMDMADEMGICVLSETGIWSSDGGPKVDSEEYWERCNDHVERLIARDKNHPSIFGWSVCNEVIPVVMHVYKAPEDIVQRQVDEVNNWCRRVLALDDTRNWVSGDGETQVRTELPTLIGHYGDDAAAKNWSSQGVPWGIGETSKAYFGTPMQLSEINGDRAFESVEGRMEALARECYDLLRLQDSLNASYQSVFNIVWYGLQPLNIGKADQSCAPKSDEGVFMTHFCEGMPGMQIERLGPYNTTLNPGYDLSLPLYKPWPMFEAIKAANGGEPYVVNNSDVDVPVICSAQTLEPIESLSIIGDQAEWSRKLRAMGANYALSAELGANSLLIINADKLSQSDIDMVKQALAVGARIYIDVPRQAVVSELNKILPSELILQNYNANSLIVEHSDAVTNGLSNRALYFSELLSLNQSVVDFVLSHQCEKYWQPLVVTCRANWQNWNYRREPIKTAMVYRTEHEREVEMAVVAKCRANENIYVNTAQWSRVPISSDLIIKRILQNLGVQFKAVAASQAVIDQSGALQSALHTSVALDKRYGSPQKAFLQQHLDNEPQLRASLNSTNGSWGLIDAQQREFAIAPATSVPIMHYLGVWIYSPRALDDLLIEPNMPKMDFISSLPNAFIYINGAQTPVEKIEGGTKAKNLKLSKGWNYMLVKFIQEPNAFERFTIDLISDREDYQQGLIGLVEQ